MSPENHYRSTYPNTNHGVDVRDDCYRGRGRCREGGKCQITRGARHPRVRG